jgi:hypothetical protein
MLEEEQGQSQQSLTRQDLDRLYVLAQRLAAGPDWSNHEAPYEILMRPPTEMAFLRKRETGLAMPEPAVAHGGRGRLGLVG